MTHQAAACGVIDRMLRSKAAWYVLVVVYVGLLFLTMYKDLYFTGNEPSPLFYFTVPIVGMAGSSVAVYPAAKLLRNPLAFTGILKIILVTEIALQAWENCAKAVYYTVWSYPGILWFISFPLAIVLTAYLFVCIYKTGWRHGMLYSVVSLAAGIVFGVIFMALTGIDTPGS